MTDTSRLLGRRLAAQIALRRRAHQLSQDQLAEQLGVATETISRFERGATLPSLVTVQRLAEALGVRIADLLGESSVATDDQVDVMLSGCAHSIRRDAHS
ncbi:MAG: helix-turn-helix transcriptional regulator [Uliginosibacterium sp.]|nr:helix-turn-helix transcriptional regulator [Uliginosibacterium sp.]